MFRQGLKHVLPITDFFVLEASLEAGGHEEISAEKGSIDTAVELLLVELALITGKQNSVTDLRPPLSGRSARGLRRQ